jgi:2-amino-4-hydroxy-6-hydroxymethyldihydropteridine diphosphokinase
MSAVPAPVTAWIGLGANLGDARETVLAAARAIADWDEGARMRLSPLYRSAPIDAGGPDFFNAVAAIDTRLSPEAVLDKLQALEMAFGRERPYRNAPRTLDLDLLLHGHARLDTPRLTLPHPRLHLRAFVLRPLLDLAPDLIVPGLGAAADHLPAVSDQAIQACNE